MSDYILEFEVHAVFEEPADIDQTLQGVIDDVQNNTAGAVPAHYGDNYIDYTDFEDVLLPELIKLSKSYPENNIIITTRAVDSSVKKPLFARTFIQNGRSEESDGQLVFGVPEWFDGGES